MPFTPLPTGPAAVVKSTVPGSFSLPLFRVVPAAVDLEVRVDYYVVGNLSPHALVHTGGGSPMVALVLLWWVRPTAVVPGVELHDRRPTEPHLAPRDARLMVDRVGVGTFRWAGGIFRGTPAYAASPRRRLVFRRGLDAGDDPFLCGIRRRRRLCPVTAAFSPTCDRRGRQAAQCRIGTTIGSCKRGRSVSSDGSPHGNSTCRRSGMRPGTAEAMYAQSGPLSKGANQRISSVSYRGSLRGVPTARQEASGHVSGSRVRLRLRPLHNPGGPLHG